VWYKLQGGVVWWSAGAKSGVACWFGGGGDDGGQAGLGSGAEMTPPPFNCFKLDYTPT
jgi:hypothetical protein